MKIIKKGKTHRTVTYRRVFSDADGCGASFDCDEHGNIDRSALEPAGLANLESCLAGERPELRDRGVERTVHVYKVPAIGRCDCGTTVQLGAFTCECAGCGALYNWGGQRLMPRRCWGGGDWADQ